MEDKYPDDENMGRVVIGDDEALRRFKGVLMRLPLEILAGAGIVPAVTGEGSHVFLGALMGLFAGMTVETLREIYIQYQAETSSTPHD